MTYLRRVPQSMGWLLAALVLFAVPAAAQNAPTKPKFDVYGFAQLDFGFQIDRINPDWYDVMRPTKLPAFEDEFGTDGNAFMSVRQSRFGVQSWVPTKAGELYTIFEFDMFGVGSDAGQTTIRLRKAYGQLGKFGAGQNNSAFMDIDVFPNTLEYWGPNGMVFFRNLQVRYTPIQGESFLNIALENPGASADQGEYADRVELDGVAAKFPLPDLTAQYRSGARLGLHPARRHPAADRVGRPEHRRLRPVGRRHRLGPQPELQHQDRQGRRAPAAGRVRRGDPELHERRPGGHRDPEQLLGSGLPDHRRGAPDVEHGGVLRPHLEREVHQLARVLLPRTSTTATGSRPTPSTPAPTWRST